MDSFTYHLYIHQSSNSSSHSSNPTFTNFPIIAIVVIGIIATAFLLVSYYIIVIKCCLKLHTTVSTNQDIDNNISLMMLSPTRVQQQPKCGLEQSIINSIPIIEFKKSETETLEAECSVCLGEFQVDEKLRCLQDCNHLFHMDCIDVWLQNNANCPLCRTAIRNTRRSTTQDLATAETTTSVDSNYVVIEIQPQPQLQLLLEQDETTSSQVLRKPKEKTMKHQQMVSMGDECIDIRSVKDDDDVFKIQPIRRSVSMDSCNDPKLYSTVQEVLVGHHRMKSSSIVTTSDHHHMGCTSCSCSIGSCSSRFRKALLSFGSGRGCKGSCSVVLP